MGSSLEIVNPSEIHDNKTARIGEGFNTLKNAVAGLLEKSLNGSADVTLTSLESVNDVMVFTGPLSAAVNIRIQAQGSSRKFTVVNHTTGGFALNVKTTAVGSTGQRVDQSCARRVWHNGTHVYPSSAQVNTQTGAPAAFSPLDLGGAVLWLRADTLTGLPDGAAVAAWGDMSGAGNNVTQGTAAQQPTYRANVISGKPVVRFDGGDVLSGATNLNLTAGLSIFFVSKNRVRKNYNGIFRLGPDTTITGSSVLELFYQAGTTDAGSGNAYYLTNRASVSSYVHDNDAAPAVNQFYLGEVIATPAAATQYLNGAARAVDGAGGSNFVPALASVPHVGIGYADPGGYLDGDLAELIVYNSALTSFNRRQVEDYLLQKYGL